ncbi:MAG: hypothetical protein M3198_11425 [Actinomycetota bacterium]|nr:hypothetical protein [Actinomycetota bacterium]
MGFGIGYVRGAKTGEERYNRIRRRLRYGRAMSKASYNTLRLTSSGIKQIKDILDQSLKGPRPPAP